MHDLAGAQVENAWAEVRADVPILAYASVVDSRTHDPVLAVAARRGR